MQPRTPCSAGIECGGRRPKEPGGGALGRVRRAFLKSAGGKSVDDTSGGDPASSCTTRLLLARPNGSSEVSRRLLAASSQVGSWTAPVPFELVADSAELLQVAVPVGDWFGVTRLRGSGVWNSGSSRIHAVENMGQQRLGWGFPGIATDVTRPLFREPLWRTANSDSESVRRLCALCSLLFNFMVPA